MISRLYSPVWIPCIILSLTLGVIFAFQDTVEDLQLKVFDAYQHLKPRIYQEVPVVIADLDDETLTRLGQWPWPRLQVADLVKRLTDLGASAVVFDIVFAEPDRTSPANIVTLWSKNPGFETVRKDIQNFPDHDQILAGTLAASNVVTGFSLTGEPNEKRPVLKASPAFSGDDPTEDLDQFQGAVANLGNLEAAAKGNGSFNIISENDGMIRRVPLFLRLGKNLYPSLVVEALRTAQGASTYVIKSSSGSGELSFGERKRIVSIKIGDFIVPTDAKGRIWLYDTGFISKRYIPVWKIFSGEAGEQAINGKIVFVGTSAAGLKDIRTTPLNPVAAGVEIHTQLAEQILLQEFLFRPDWAPGAELVFLILLALALILLMPLLGALFCALIGGAAVAAVFGLSWYAFASAHWLIDPLLPSLAVFMVYLVSSLINHLRTEAEKKQVRGAFSRYLSPDVVEQLAEHPEWLKLGGEMKNMTFLFADVRDFTSFSEQLTAHELTSVINSFLTPMTDLILKQKGTIDKYMGDCIMAFWNAPLDDPNHARNACQSALNMRNYLVKWNQDAKKEAEVKGKKYFPIHIGVGLNTGDCCVGNMGSEQRFDYSVLGDEVNLASRLEGQSKTYGVDIVMGKNTYDQASDFAAVELDLIRVKGKLKPVRIFALIGDPDFKKQEVFQKLSAAHEAMLEAYRAQDWTKAKYYLAECKQTDTARTRLRILYELYSKRISDYEAQPPGVEWDGVAVATSK